MGARLAAVRQALDLTQDALGEIMGVGATTVSGWESGRNQIDIVGLARASEVLGFSTDWVARGDLGGVRFDLAIKLQRVAALDIGRPQRGRPKSNRERARTAKPGPHPDRT